MQIERRTPTPGRRQLNGPQTTGREYLSEPTHGMLPEERPGSRRYLTVPPTEDLAQGAGMPRHLTWTTPPLASDLDVVGHLELRLTAESTAPDTGWIVLLQDVAADGSATDVTQGWLRASMREVDEAASVPGRPVLPLRRMTPVPLGEPVDYRIPLVANARPFLAGHRIRLTLTSDDSRPGAHAMLGFTHTPVGTAGVNTVHASSRLLLPVLSAR